MDASVAGHNLWISLVWLSMLSLVGCADTAADRNQPRARNGIAEYRQVTTDAGKAMHAAMAVLGKVSAQSNGCSPKLLAAFSKETRRLQIDSVQLRARAQAIQARGDAYFSQWNEHLERVKDPELRALAQQRRPELEQSFQRIKVLSQQAREAFGPFESGLRKLRNALESNPDSLNVRSTQECITAAKRNGEIVEQCLASIIGELDYMRVLLTPHNRAEPHTRA